MLLAETIRQAGLAVSHLGFGVASGQQAIMHSLGFQLIAAEPVADQAAVELTAEVTTHDPGYRAGRLRRLTVRLAFGHRGRVFATGHGTLSWLSPAGFSALRARSACGPRRFPDQPALALAGRVRAAGDSVLAPDPAGRANHWRLVVPVGHPVYFDHPLDHVPGLVLADAVWQAAAELGRPPQRLQELELECLGFTELTGAIELSLSPAAPAPSGAWTYRISQNGRDTARGTVVLGRTAAAGIEPESGGD